MPERAYTEYVKSAFRPLVAATGRLTLLDQLFTKSIPKEKQEKLFRQFKILRLDQSQVITLPDGGFLAKLTGGEHEIFLVCSSSMNEEEGRNFVDDCSGVHGLIPVEFDESIFLIVAHEISGRFKIKDEYRSKARASDFVDVVDAEYQGHEVADLRDTYRPVLAFEIPVDCSLSGADIFDLALEILGSHAALRSPIIDDDIAKQVVALRGGQTCTSENLVQALIASQWRYSFLELYRCLEALYFFPWVRSFKKSTKSEMGVDELRKYCRDNLRWREKEKESIAELFEIVNSEKIKDREKHISVFKELVNNENSSRSSYGYRLYSIRNSLVHHENKDSIEVGMPGFEDWRLLTLYVAVFLEEFNTMYSRDFTQ